MPSKNLFVITAYGVKHVYVNYMYITLKSIQTLAYFLQNINLITELQIKIKCW